MYFGGLIIASIVVATLIVLLRRRPVFEITVESGRAHIISGKPPREFVREFRALCEDFDIASATIRGVRGAGTVRLEFSSGIPESHHQRIRNIWSIHARRSPPPGGDPPNTSRMA